MRKVAIADVEKGTLSVVHHSANVRRRPVRSTADLEAIAWSFARGEQRQFQTVGIDNITEMQTINLRENVQSAIKSGRNMVKNRQRTVDDIWQEDYLKSTSQLTRIVSMFRDLPVNLIITAHLKRVYPNVPEGTDLSKLEPLSVVPSLSQKLMINIMGMMDFVWCLEQDTEEESETYGKRFMITVSKDIYKCKTRGPKFLKAVGEVITDPTLPEIYDTFVRTATATKKRSA